MAPARIAAVLAIVGALLLPPALQAAGADYRSNTQPWTSHVVQDRELITGQNPASAADVGKLLLTRLAAPR
jgi:putative intracellular protease/amidase